MTIVVIDDHLLRDLVADDLTGQGRDLAGDLTIATTNLYYLRLCKSVTVAAGGRLTGSWPTEARQALGRSLVSLPTHIEVVPLRSIAVRMAELGVPPRLSTLGAEAIAAAERLGAELWVWDGDDGPAIRSAAGALGVPYRTVKR